MNAEQAPSTATAAAQVGSDAESTAPLGNGRSWRVGVWPFAARFFADYRRNPVNVLLLILVPVVFVVVAAGSLADAARVLGGQGAPAVETNVAGWAAGYLAGIAMYFQVAAAREADQRLVLSGLAVWRMVTARLLTGLALAALASAAALLALGARTGIAHPGRAVAGTMMFALIYLAIGAMVGARVRNPVNGTVIILFVWILDVFFGPTMGAADRLLTRGLPTHFVSLYMVDVPSRHGGRIGDLGLALTWTAAALIAAFAVVTMTTRIATGRRAGRRRPGSAFDQVWTGLRVGLHGQRRNPALWALLAVVPTVFILLANAVTPDHPAMLQVVEGGRAITRTVSLVRFHAGTMAPIAVASLATLIGLFTILDARAGDRRLALAGVRPARLLAIRLGLVLAATMVAAAVSLGVTALVFRPDQPVPYVASVVLIAITYALLGMLLGPLFGRVAGVFVAFVVPFLDLGIGQSPMLRDQPAPWAHVLPGYGSVRMLLDAAVTTRFDATGPLLLALAWIAGLGLLAALIFRHTTAAPGSSSADLAEAGGSLPDDAAVRRAAGPDG